MCTTPITIIMSDERIDQLWYAIPPPFSRRFFFFFFKFRVVPPSGAVRRWWRNNRDDTRPSPSTAAVRKIVLFERSNRNVNRGAKSFGTSVFREIFPNYYSRRLDNACYCLSPYPVTLAHSPCLFNPRCTRSFVQILFYNIQGVPPIFTLSYISRVNYIETGDSQNLFFLKTHRA